MREKNLPEIWDPPLTGGGGGEGMDGAAVIGGAMDGAAVTGHAMDGGGVAGPWGGTPPPDAVHLALSGQVQSLLACERGVSKPLKE